MLEDFEVCALSWGLIWSLMGCALCRHRCVRAPQDLKGRALLEDPSERARVCVVITVRAAVSRMWDRDWLLGYISRGVRY